MNQHRIAIFASGSGSNAEEITKYFKSHPTISVELILTNNPAAGVIERANRLGVPLRVFNKSQFNTSDTVVDWLREAGITHVVLAGFLLLIPQNLLDAYPDRIINIHPALLPLFGGKGMYGAKVHDAVRAAGATETGITIHLVNEHYDEGRIIFQATCPVDASCSADDIASRVHALEYQHYPQQIEKWILNS